MHFHIHSVLLTENHFTFFHTTSTKYTVSIENYALFFLVVPSNFRLKIDYNDIAQNIPGKKCTAFPLKTEKFQRLSGKLLKKYKHLVGPYIFSN